VTQKEQLRLLFLVGHGEVIKGSKGAVLVEDEPGSRKNAAAFYV